MKTIKTLTIPALLMMVILNTSCEKRVPPELFRITIKNNSQGTIGSHIPNLTKLAARDTALTAEKPILQFAAPGGLIYYDLDQDWGKLFRNSDVQTVSFFFIDSTVYHTVNWQQIKDSNMILKRADYSVDELEAAGWQIAYP